MFSSNKAENASIKPMDSLPEKIVTRFAPSPTGYLHVGGLRTALYAYLVAKQSGGTFIMRVEDTDRERYVEGAVENMLQAMQWAGIMPDEGVTFDGTAVAQIGQNGPYIQSEKLPRYQACAKELVDRGQAYYCFCSPERLEEVREYRQTNKLPPGYDGHCKTLCADEVSAKLATGERHVIRLTMPDDGEVSFIDTVRGEVTFKNADVDDQVLLKSDGFPTYHLAVVVDDHDMEITHVIRGEEWISSTPKHLTLYRFFGWKPPKFAHLPLLLNSDKSKLSKRQGDVAVLDYRTKGYLPEALVNFVAFLGWNPGTEQEIFSLDELVTAFDLTKVQKAGAVFNLEKLDWFNREYLKKLSLTELVDYIEMYIPAQLHGVYSRDQLEKIAPILLERMSKGSDLADMYAAGELAYFFKAPDYDASNLLWKALREDITGREKTAAHLSHAVELLSSTTNFTEAAVKAVLWNYAEKEGKGFVLWPMRYALSGRDKSPDPFVLASVLGKDETISRIKTAIAKLA